MGFKVYIFENNIITFSVQTTKMLICENGDVMCMRILCSRRASLQSGIANYWPVMHYTALTLSHLQVIGVRFDNVVCT